MRAHPLVVLAFLDTSVLLYSILFYSILFDSAALVLPRHLILVGSVLSIQLAEILTKKSFPENLLTDCQKEYAFGLIYEMVHLERRTVVTDHPGS